MSTHIPNITTAALACLLASGSWAGDSLNDPLTDKELESFSLSIVKCWNIGGLDDAARGTSVMVTFSLTEEARPITDSIRMKSASGGDSQAAEKAFQAARRAIIRCGSQGLDLPSDKYDQWRDVAITFNPESMRIK